MKDVMWRPVKLIAKLAVLTAAAIAALHHYLTEPCEP